MFTKKFLFPFLAGLLVASLVLAGCAAATEAPSKAVTDVTAQKAYTLVQENRSNPDFIILDVRTAQEYSDGHVAGATNLDFYSPTFRSSLDALDKNKTYLVYCRSGSRSRQSVDIMLELGFKSISHMTGGIIEWNTNGLPTVKEVPTTSMNPVSLVLLLRLTPIVPALL